MLLRRRIVFGLAGIGFGALLLLLAGLGLNFLGATNNTASDDPLVWESDIRAFEVSAERFPPVQDAVLFLGSSSIRLWDSLSADMHPIPVIRRGFGGAKLDDLVYYAERLLNVPPPLAIVIFAGTNDITPIAAKKPGEVLRKYQQLVGRVRELLPAVPIYYIAITPSPRRWQVWPIAQQANRLIQDYIESSKNLYFIDTGPALLNQQDLPNKNNYRRDGLHLSVRGYKIWRDMIYSRLLMDFPCYQTARK